MRRDPGPLSSLRHGVAFALAGLVIVGASACPPPTPDTDGQVDADLELEPAGPSGLTMLQRLPGLWTGPATSSTALGDFAIMSMDVRDVDGRTLFARGDLDADNSIRFAFVTELHPDGSGVERPTFIFRNGGLFLGLARDARARLVDADDDGGVWRFCDVVRGCAYVDATWTIDGDTLTLESLVRGEPHMRWEARRVEARPLPTTFPLDAAPGAADADFPPMAAWTATVDFPALADDADVWVLLSTRACGTTFACTPSRSKRAAVGVGATSVDIVIEQLHPGDYVANVVLDRDRDMETTLRPTSGDGAARLDTAVVVTAGGAVTTLPIVFTVP